MNQLTLEGEPLKTPFEWMLQYIEDTPDEYFLEAEKRWREKILHD